MGLFRPLCVEVGGFSTNSELSILAGVFPFLRGLEEVGLLGVEETASGIFCLLDWRAEEPGSTLLGLFSVMADFRFRDGDIVGGVEVSATGRAAGGAAAAEVAIDGGAEGWAA